MFILDGRCCGAARFHSRERDERKLWGKYPQEQNQRRKPNTVTSIDTTSGRKNASAKPRSRRPSMSRLLPEGSAGAVTHYVETQWPRIGGVALSPLPGDAFTNPAFTERYEPGMLTAVYAAGCGFDHASTGATGLVGVARRLLAAIHKISTTTQTDLRSRLRELNADRYGALTISADGYPCSDLGFNTWMMQHILPVGRPLAGSPVAIGDRCLTVRLPADMTAREFDKQLAARMKGARLNGWLGTAEGRKHCAILKVDPAQFKRGTTYRFNSGMRRSDDAEIYFFRPKTDDADRLLRLAEAIVHQHVMTPPALRTSVSWRSRSQGTRSDFEGE